MSQYVYGKNVVKQLLSNPEKIIELYATKENMDLINQAKSKNVSVNISDKKTLDKLSNGGNHQGVMVKIDDYKLYSVDEIIANKKGENQGLIVMLDELEDPHNLGAILRSCDAVGVDGVIIKKNNACGLTPTVAKVSVGAIDTVMVSEVTNLVQTLKYLKDKGYWVVGTDVNKAQDYREVKYDMNTVLVIGNEGKGISRLVKENCDFLIKLPMVGEISSLNASVACGIMLYQIYNSRFPL